eukprot:4671477-Alexandrium_andersonii.AAC.1
MGGWSAFAGGAAQQQAPLQDPWAGASWGQGWAYSPPVQGRPLECGVDLRMWSDSYAVLGLKAQPRGYRFWKSKSAPI